MSRRRGAALGSLVCGLAALVLALVLAVERFPRGLLLLACLWLALYAGWLVLRHEGPLRVIAAIVALAAVVAGVVTLLTEDELIGDLVVLVAFALSVVLARVAFAARVELPLAQRPEHAFLFFNPKSGGGKAERFRLAEEARKRGIEAVELALGDDLRALVERAITTGADALAMAGGDGSQAIVAEMAAANDLPYACIPAGTRNHFALDLGVDRDDIVGSLDALVDGGERRVDLAEVNGRVFVNNVSLGLYAEAVQQEGYRDAKLRTLMKMAPAELRGQPPSASFSWRGADGEAGEGALTLLVSNNVYRLGRVIGSGTRPQLDGEVLGIAAATSRRGGSSGGLAFEQWSAPEFTVEGEGQIAAGVDGEAVTLSPPIRFRSRPGALRVRIARSHPGASPTHEVPAGFGRVVLALFGIVLGDRQLSDRT